MAGDDEALTGAALGRDLADLSASLSSVEDPSIDPDNVVRLAVRALPHAQACGLTLLRRGRQARTLPAVTPCPTGSMRSSSRPGRGRV